MKIYQVGGSIRDELLGLPVTECDWLVLESSPKSMIAAGYQQVGKDFPVFLHPETKEEYALARTERKTAAGYHGFEFDISPKVTLEEDLLRRDLTINTLVKDSEGNILDHFGAKKDLENRILRHVSPAFTEDPVRVLRVARFAARFHYLGFRVAEETMALIRTMASSGELNHLVPQRVWQELYKALSMKNPSQFILTLREGGALKVIFPEVDRLFGVPQTEKYHPEIDTGRHVMMALERAVIINNDPRVVFATLMHDLGKGLTPENILPRHIGHEGRGKKPVQDICQRLAVPKEFKELALLVTEYHTRIYRVADMRADTIVKLFLKLDAFRRPDRFSLFLQACQADVQGRLGKENEPFIYGTLMTQLLSAANQADIRLIHEEGLQGKDFAERLNQLRVSKVGACLKQLKLT